MKKGVIVLFLSISFIFASAKGFPPSYYDIKKTSLQKKRFAQILKPLIEKANKKTLKERAFVNRFFNKMISFSTIEPSDLNRLVKLAKKYKIKNLFDKNSYLMRIDTVPVSLALTQAAIESGWGKSRFAKAANNIYGHWTYSLKGMVPQFRDEGKTHKIRVFNSLQDSVDAYVLNLNRNRAYKDFRIARAQARAMNMAFNGLDAAKTMINYSQKKEKYVKMLTRIMKSNNFTKFDNTNSPKKGASFSLYAYLR